jgi:hypothetical protein
MKAIDFQMISNGCQKYQVPSSMLGEARDYEVYQREHIHL